MASTGPYRYAFMAPLSTSSTESENSTAAPRRRALDFRKYTKQIWLAGLGAFSRAEEEGTRLFETLVQVGAELESKSSDLSPQDEAGAASANPDSESRAASRLQDGRDRLERLLDDGLAQAMSRQGLPSGRDVQQLSDRVQELQLQIQALTTEVQALRASNTDDAS